MLHVALTIWSGVLTAKRSPGRPMAAGGKASSGSERRMTAVYTASRMLGAALSSALILENASWRPLQAVYATHLAKRSSSTRDARLLEVTLSRMGIVGRAPGQEGRPRTKQGLLMGIPKSLLGLLTRSSTSPNKTRVESSEPDDSQLQCYGG